MVKVGGPAARDGQGLFLFSKTIKMKLSEAINKHSAKLECLHNRFKLNSIGPLSETTVRIGCQQKGAIYINSLMDLFQNETISDFGDPEETNQIAPIQVNEKPGFWKFLDNLLDGFVNTSAAYSAVRSNVTGRPTGYDYQYMANRRQSNLMWIGAFVAIIIVLIIIFKK